MTRWHFTTHGKGLDGIPHTPYLKDEGNLIEASISWLRCKMGNVAWMIGVEKEQVSGDFTTIAPSIAFDSQTRVDRLTRESGENELQ